MQDYVANFRRMLLEEAAANMARGTTAGELPPHPAVVAKAEQVGMGTQWISTVNCTADVDC